MCVSVNNIPRVLQEVKSPRVMNAIGALLPQVGMCLVWSQGGTLLSKVLLKVTSFLFISNQPFNKDEQATVYLGSRELEWLFLTCHNLWIMFHLTRVNNERVLVYSPILNIHNSSIPFCACLGAVLSEVRNFPVEPTTFPADATLDILPPPPDNDDDDDKSGEYELSAHGNSPSDRPLACSRSKATGEYNLMVSFLSFLLTSKLTGFECCTARLVPCQIGQASWWALSPEYTMPFHRTPTYE